MIGEVITSKHLVFKCTNILQSGVLMKRKKRVGEMERISKTSTKITLMLVKMILACNQLCLLTAVKT